MRRRGGARVAGSFCSILIGCIGSPAMPRPSISSEPGVSASTPLPPASISAASGSSRPLGSRSKSTPMISAPDMPSIIAWCILVRIAQRSPASPWIRYSSHSGRERSRWREAIRVTCSARRLSSPGSGRASSRRWYSRSKLGVLDPVGAVEAERHLGELPAHHRQQRHALVEQLVHVLEPQPAPRPGRGVEDDEATDVAEMGGALDRQKLRVEAGQLPHLPSSPERRYDGAMQRIPAQASAVPVIRIAARNEAGDG